MSKHAKAEVSGSVYFGSLSGQTRCREVANASRASVMMSFPSYLSAGALSRSTRPPLVDTGVLRLPTFEVPSGPVPLTMTRSACGWLCLDMVCRYPGETAAAAGFVWLSPAVLGPQTRFWNSPCGSDLYGAAGKAALPPTWAAAKARLFGNGFVRLGSTTARSRMW